MLVLARRPQEQIQFPTLGISVEILRVTGQIVRVGVSAPREVPVVRGELCPNGTPAADGKPVRGLDHRLRGRLNTAMMAMYVAQKQLQMGAAGAVEHTLRHALDELERLESDLAARKTRPAGAGAGPIKALLVDDNANESALLLSYLQMSGIEVEQASDGSDALDYLGCHALPDAVLLDMRMPRCDGPTTVAAIRANPAYSGLRIFAVTGAAPGEYNLPSGRRGVDGWFTKPLNPARIVETLTRTFQVA